MIKITVLENKSIYLNGEIGVQNDNKSVIVPIYLPTMAGEINVRQAQVYLLVKNGLGCDVVPLNVMEEIEASGTSLYAPWTVLRSHVYPPNLELQIKVFDVLTDSVWVSHKLSVIVSPSIDADGELYELFPAILDRHETRINKLEHAGSLKRHDFDGQQQFPDPPDKQQEGDFFCDTTTNSLYRWDDVEQKYFCIGSDYYNLTVISGGNALGGIS